MNLVGHRGVEPRRAENSAELFRPRTSLFDSYLAPLCTRHWNLFCDPLVHREGFEPSLTGF